jgi:hypothetical protein
MRTVLPAIAPQTLYVTIRRDELRAIKDEREQLQKKVAHLNMMLQQAQLTAQDTALQA